MTKKENSRHHNHPRPTTPAPLGYSSGSYSHKTTARYPPISTEDRKIKTQTKSPVARGSHPLGVLWYLAVPPHPPSASLAKGGSPSTGGSADNQREGCTRILEHMWNRVGGSCVEAPLSEAALSRFARFAPRARGKFSLSSGWELDRYLTHAIRSIHRLCPLAHSAAIVARARDAHPIFNITDN